MEMKTVAEVKIIETEEGFNIEVKGERAKELLNRWKSGQSCCSCC